MSQRVVPLMDVFNFRDLGGYPTVDGREVAWGRLFRSDDLSRLAPRDVSRLAALGIRTVIDLRRPAEIAEDGRVPASDGYGYRHVYLPHPAWQQTEFPDTTTRIRYLVDRYLELADHAGNAIGHVLRLIADPGLAAVVVHCVAGKDRTGVVCGLALSLLGVSDEDIADDFALSEAAEEALWAYRCRDEPQALPRRWTHFQVSPREAMLVFLAELRDRYGSVDHFAASIGVTAGHLGAMRAHLLS